MMAKQMRLDRFLAEMGQGTRSGVREQIRKGRVTVNGSLEKKPERKIEAGKDRIVLDGREISYVCLEYYMLNKPAGVLSATEDKKRETVLDLITEKSRKDLFPVGRLDKDTEGLLIITNDGELAHRLLSPKKHVDKTYYAELDKKLTGEAASRLMEGVDIGDEKPTLPCVISRLSDTTCFITIREGRYHEIKRMFKTEGLHVEELRRISMGPLALDPSLGPGEYRPLTGEEISMLKDFDRTDGE